MLHLAWTADSGCVKPEEYEYAAPLRQVLELLENEVGVHPIEVSHLTRVEPCRTDHGGTPWDVDYRHVNAHEKLCMI
jgi:hypothetical protein